VPAFTDNAYVRLGAFIGYECVVGMWFTSFHSMRTLIVPSEGHATILSLYRLPLNFIVVLVILNIKNFSPELVFTGCFVMNLLAMVLQWRVHSITDKRGLTGGNKRAGTPKRGDSLTIDTPNDDNNNKNNGSVTLDNPPMRRRGKSPMVGGVRVSPTASNSKMKKSPKGASATMKCAASPAMNSKKMK